MPYVMDQTNDCCNRLLIIIARCWDTFAPTDIIVSVKQRCLNLGAAEINAKPRVY